MQQTTQENILLRRAVNEKDRKALSWLYTKYHRNIKRFMLSCVSSVTDAEDLVQNVFVELCKGNDDYKEYRNAQAYLFAIARNLVGQYRRKKSTQIKTIPIKSIDQVSARDKARRYRNLEGQISPPEIKKIKNLLNKLSPKAQQAIKLRFIEGLTPKDAAKKAGCSVDAFYRRFYKGLKTLRTKISKEPL